MEVRLVQLLASFIGVSADYALARLEFALRDPAVPAPPIIERLPDASEESLRSRWPEIEAQLDAALTYTKHLPPTRSNDDEKGASGWLRRTVREMDQYARAIRWVLTVTER
jgi:hypothetical protein